MLPSVGYFKSIICPFLAGSNGEIDGKCNRPYCQYRHEHLPAKPPSKPVPTLNKSEAGPSQERGEHKAAAIEQIVSEAVKRVLKENSGLLESFDASKILELVHQQQLVEKVVEGLVPSPSDATKSSVSSCSSKSKGHKSYTIPAGTPSYKPTPIEVLKKAKPTTSKVESYIPTDKSTKSTASSGLYQPSRVQSTHKQDAFVPSGMVPEVSYFPSTKDSNNTHNDCYKPPSNLTYNIVNYEPTSKELSTTEPSYSPSCTGLIMDVDYSPSPALQVEPTYSPVESSSQMEVDYQPSAIGSCTLSPEKYLELFENTDEEGGKETKKEKCSRKSSKEEEEKRRKEKERLRRKEKEKRSSKSKSSNHKHSDDKSSSSSFKRSSKSKSSSSSSHEKSKVKAGLDSDSDVDDECYRIFQEYQPSEDQSDISKKRKSEELSSSAVEDPVIPLKKQRVAHVVGATPARPVAVNPKPPPRLSPGMMMIERFKKLQEAKSLASGSSSVQTSSLPSSASSGTEKKRIAHVPNTSTMCSSKPNVSQPTASLSKPTVQQSRTLPVATVKPTVQKAVPKLPRPTIAVELGCRVPASIRQKYLNVLVDETLKIYDREEDAYQRAVEEEKTAYAKCSSKVVYINVITNLVQRIRREVESNSSQPASSQSKPKTISHSAVIAGKGGATVSWSIEKRNGQIDSSLLKGTALYKLLERYILTLEQQDFHGYPRPDPTEKGKAIINTANKFRQSKSSASLNLGPGDRLCDRCGRVYKVNSKGIAIKEDDFCTFHWGKAFQRRGDRRYTCCQGEANSEGCSVSKWHISEMASGENVRSGFVRTMSKPAPTDENYGVYALDCEMCYTTEGTELTRVTVISSDCTVVYETLVKPDNPILDYNTRFSGISEEDLINVKTTIRDVQAVLLSKFCDKTILIGHSFDSDLRALKIIHDTVIDTSVVFPHPKGSPYKRALRTLCGEILQKIIQNDVGGHDSAEDARACMELMLHKVKQDLKLLK